jgi:hypothetical protein
LAIFLASSVSAIDSVPESEIPAQYTEGQLSALNEVFDEISVLTAGTAQMSHSEFEELNSSVASYSDEQKAVLNLLLTDTWSLIEGTAQLSDSEFLELKEKYHLTETSPPDDQNQTDQNQTQDDQQNQTQDDDDEPQDEDQDDSQDQQDQTDQNTQSTSNNDQQTTSTSSSSDNDEKIVLNSGSAQSQGSSKEFTTLEGNIRLTAVYVFSAMCVFIIILLALRRL